MLEESESNTPDLYEFLGISRDSRSEAVDAAYAARAAEYKRTFARDPSALRAAFERLNDAYRVLGTPLLRSDYDHRLRGEVQPSSLGGSEAHTDAEVAKADGGVRRVSWPLVIAGATGLVLLLALVLFGGAPFGIGGQEQDGPEAAAARDEKYVLGVCRAGKALRDGAEQYIHNRTSGGEFDAIEPIKSFAAAIRKASPPDDLKDWHRQYSAALDKAAADLGQTDAKMFRLGPDTLALLRLVTGGTVTLGATALLPDLPPVPTVPQDRLAGIAAHNPDCKAAGFFGIEPGNQRPSA